jgi:hypothetical protein
MTLARFLLGGGGFPHYVVISGNTTRERHTADRPFFYKSKKNQFIFEGGEKISLPYRRIERRAFCPKELFLYGSKIQSFKDSRASGRVLCMDAEKNVRISNCENVFAYSHMLTNRRDVAGIVPWQNEKENSKAGSSSEMYGLFPNRASSLITNH